MWPNKYLTAHYKLTRIPDAAPTFLDDSLKCRHEEANLYVFQTMAILNTAYKNTTESIIFSVGGGGIASTCMFKM